MLKSALSRVSRKGGEPSWQAIKDNLITMISGKPNAAVLSSRIRRMTQERGEGFRTWTKRAMQALAVAHGRQPDDEELMHFIVEGANEDTATHISSKDLRIWRTCLS
jgi:hypothetical protein